MFKLDRKTVDWLMEGDPAIRWQVQRDLLDAKPTVYEKERAKIAKQGWGARYLAKQDKEGVWADGLYSPKWKSTYYTLWTLRFLGLAPGHPQALKALRILMDEGFCPDHGIDYSDEHARRLRVKRGLPAPARRGRGETCMTGMALAMFTYFEFEDQRNELIAQHLLDHQMRDRGWNCQYPRRATHASFHTTLSVLEGLREYLSHFPSTKLPLNKAMKEGREFLLQHHLYRSHRTGNIASTAFTRYPSQPTWRYDFLRALDHFRATDAPKDARLDDPITLLLSRHDESGRWPEYSQGTSASVWFHMETPGKPSRWNTLRALRVLKWWEE